MSVVEELVDDIAGDNQVRQSYLRESLLRYSSEIAFAAAEFYAQAAETRGAWDARLQDLVLDAILSGASGDALLSRASAAGWNSSQNVFALIGPIPSSQSASEVAMEQIRRTAKTAKLEVMVGVHSDRLVTIIGGITEDTATELVVRPFVAHFGSGTVVVGPVVATLEHAHESAHAALSGFRSLGYVADSPRLINSKDLIAARVLNGDTAAIDPIVTQIRNNLKADVIQTLATYLEESPSIEGCARTLFVHVNTVRYRLKGVLEATGLDPFEPSDALILRLALMVERNTANL
jgi:hypothetical protein